MSIVRKGENWFIDYRANGRRIREKIGPSRKLAESVLSKRRLELAEKRFLDVRKTSRETLREFAERYLEWLQGRIRTAYSDRQRAGRLLRTFGSLRLAEIDIAAAEKYMTQRLQEPRQHPFQGRAGKASKAQLEAWNASHSKPVSKATVNREIALLRKMLNKAVEWKVIPANPMLGIKLFDEREFIRKRYLKPDEIKLLLECCAPGIRDVVTFALYTGRRQGEILGMRWQDVDLANGFVYFPRTKKKEPDQLAIPPRARELLARLADGPRRESVFGLRYARTQFMAACAKAGIQDFRFHDLRHTAVSYMMMNGIDLKTIAVLVGHTTTVMVDQRYGHLSPDHKRVATEIYGAAMDRLCGFAKEKAISSRRVDV